MGGPERDDGWRPVTVTHARLRAEQGDVDGARATLRRILLDRPGDLEADSLLRELQGRGSSPREEPEDEALAPPAPGDPGRLAERFRAELEDAAPRDPRVGNLRRWLVRIARREG